MKIPALLCESLDWQIVNRAVNKLGNEDGWSEEDLLSLCRLTEVWFKRGSVVGQLDNDGKMIIRFDCEAVTWTLGESLRRILQRNKKLRSSARFFDAVVAVCNDQRLGRGRESFTMLLGQYGGKSQIPVLIRLLDDPDVDGHAVYALRLLGAKEATEKVRPFLQSPKSWVKKEALKFFEKTQLAD